MTKIEITKKFRTHLLCCNGAVYNKFIGSQLEADCVSFIMKQNIPSYKEVIERLNEELKDPSTRQGWVANIAMSQMDNERWYREKHNLPYEAAELLGLEQKILNEIIL